jgi:tRNA(fMet)-specific endonuclease VapC
VAGRLLPDTNAFILFLAGDVTVVDLLAGASEVLLSAVVLGELTFGALNSRRAQPNIERLEWLRETCSFAPVDEAVVREYGRIRMGLKLRGRPIPENDLWIAATAAATDSTVLTDDAHFQGIDGLKVQWVSRP